MEGGDGVHVFPGFPHVFEHFLYLMSHHFTRFAALGQHKQVWVEVARAALWRESTTVMNVVSTYIISMYMIRGIAGQELSSCRKLFAHLL